MVNTQFCSWSWSIHGEGEEEGAMLLLFFKVGVVEGNTMVQQAVTCFWVTGFLCWGLKQLGGYSAFESIQKTDRWPKSLSRTWAVFQESWNVSSRAVFLSFDCTEGSAERPHLPSFLSSAPFFLCPLRNCPWEGQPSFDPEEDPPSALPLPITDSAHKYHYLNGYMWWKIKALESSISAVSKWCNETDTSETHSLWVLELSPGKHVDFSAAPCGTSWELMTFFRCKTRGKSQPSVFHCEATENWGNLIPQEQAVIEDKATWIWWKHPRSHRTSVRSQVISDKLIPRGFYRRGTVFDILHSYKEEILWRSFNVVKVILCFL